MDNNSFPDPRSEEQLSITIDDVMRSLNEAASNDPYETKSHVEAAHETDQKKQAENSKKDIEKNDSAQAVNADRIKSEKTAQNSNTHISAKGSVTQADKPNSSEKNVLNKPDKNAVSHADEPNEKTCENCSDQTPAPAPKLSDMTVMEHTASIWQYKDIIDNGTEMHSEFHTKHTLTSSAEIIGARVRGKKHKHEGTNCDDYFETAVTSDCVIVVVCDGAGSKPLSRIGSRVSAETAAAFLKEKLSELFDKKPEIRDGLCAGLNSTEFMASCGRIAPLLQASAREAFTAQQSQIPMLSENEKYTSLLNRKPVISDLYTTFLAAVIVPLTVDGKRETFLACVQIGDGCICALNGAADSENCLRLMGEADSGAFSGETEFLSEKNSRPEILGAKTRISRGCSDTVFLMTDGVADDYFPVQPMMKRLFLDLSLNGILPMERGGYSAPGGEDPAPIRFKSVTPSQQSVALQYSKQLLSEKSPNTVNAVNALWDKREALYCHSLEAFRMNIGDSPEERLCAWLDNYNERGSFDDRTLVAVRILTKADPKTAK